MQCIARAMSRTSFKPRSVTFSSRFGKGKRYKMYTTWRDRGAKRTNIGVNNDFGGQVLCRGRAFGKQREIKLITTVFADVLISKENTRGGRRVNTRRNFIPFARLLGNDPRDGEKTETESETSAARRRERWKQRRERVTALFSRSLFILLGLKVLQSPSRRRLWPPRDPRSLRTTVPPLNHRWHPMTRGWVLIYVRRERNFFQELQVPASRLAAIQPPLRRLLLR